MIEAFALVFCLDLSFSSSSIQGYRAGAAVHCESVYGLPTQEVCEQLGSDMSDNYALYYNPRAIGVARNRGQSERTDRYSVRRDRLQYQCVPSKVSSPEESK